MTTPRELGKIFKDAREKRGISVNEANKKSRIHVRVIQEFENGIFDRIGKIYTRGFIKKYSDFLGLNTKDILKKFETIASSINEKEFTFNVEEEGDKAERTKGILVFTKKNIQVTLIAGVTILLVVLLLVLVGKIKSKFATPKNPKLVTARRVSEPRTSTVTAAPKPVRVVPPREVSEPAQNEMPINLKVRATGEVWVKVMKGDEQIFVGTLQDGESKTWSSDKPLTIWSGKAERLIFIVNTRRVGAVAAGVVKNIEVSEKGVKVNGNWVAYL